MIESVAIRNFRCFKDLTLHDLKRITLIVGENNSGKTSLLEALFLLLGARNPDISLRLNAWRGIQQYASNWEETWGWLFYGKQMAAAIDFLLQSGRQLTVTRRVISHDDPRVMRLKIASPGGMIAPIKATPR